MRASVLSSSRTRLPYEHSSSLNPVLRGRSYAKRPVSRLLVQARQDPFSTLEVSRDASDVEIKKAYRFMALKHHPDLNKDVPEAELKFMAIQQAYEILSGKARGKDIDEASSPGNWDWHDWYWRFRVDNARTRQQSPDKRPRPSTHKTQVEGQLQGLHRRSAARARTHSASQQEQVQDSSPPQCSAAAAPPPEQPETPPVSFESNVDLPDPSDSQFMYNNTPAEPLASTWEPEGNLDADFFLKMCVTMEDGVWGGAAQSEGYTPPKAKPVFNMSSVSKQMAGLQRKSKMAREAAKAVL
jgi:hypothetical protein